MTGAGVTQERSPYVPRGPRQIAASAIEAARAGAAVVHCHVRDPETGAPSRKPEYYRELTDRIRAAEVDVAHWTGRQDDHGPNHRSLSPLRKLSLMRSEHPGINSS